MSTIFSPVKGYNGIICGVSFINGVGDTTHDSALSYFISNGYGIDSDAPVLETEDILADVDLTEIGVKKDVVDVDSTRDTSALELSLREMANDEILALCEEHSVVSAKRSLDDIVADLVLKMSE